MAPTDSELVNLYDTCIHLPITTHRPPVPFGKKDYKEESTPGVADMSSEAIEGLSYDEVTFARHPRERHEHAGDLPDWFSDNQTATLKIVCPISTSTWGARVVLCEVKSPAVAFWRKMGHKIPTMVVAKIFDPLYYRDCPDMVAEADREYAHEAAAYMHLHDHRQHPSYANKPGLVPRFYGTWTTDITTEHLRKSFMSKPLRKATAAREAKNRAAFDAAVLAAKPSGSSSQTTTLAPQKFRPVRIILLEHIKGSSLSQHLVPAKDDDGYATVVPNLEYESEEKRLAIFASIVDTVVRIEHLGIKIDDIRPSNFIITKKNDPANKKSDPANKKNDSANKTQCDVVMTDFSLTTVNKYTRMGWDLDEWLPRPMHPLTSRDPHDWYSFLGWIPERWLEDPDSYESWGESRFPITDYSPPDVVDWWAKKKHYEEELLKHGMIPPEDDDDDPEWDEKPQRHANDPHGETMTYDNVNNFQSFDDYEKYQKDSAKESRALAALAEAKELVRVRELMERTAKYKADAEARRAAEEGHAEPVETGDPPRREVAEGDVQRLGQQIERLGLSAAPGASSSGSPRPFARPGSSGSPRPSGSSREPDEQMYPKDSKSSDSKKLFGPAQRRRSGHVRESAFDEDPEEEDPFVRPTSSSSSRRTDSSRPLASSGQSGSSRRRAQNRSDETDDTVDTAGTIDSVFTHRTGGTAETADTVYSTQSASSGHSAWRRQRAKVGSPLREEDEDDKGPKEGEDYNPDLYKSN
ncbi:hypothetical protein F5X68DRAFT_266151 [Plectosphaerella plurivora]|uniref:Protein kinase domain-containing protein n=1 Tax=Plectosphaerella plurivora TaxID=936078 RepID=A0A9P8V140_9PEZI|nr:hypothetical protein F5X68DRAFT_266151 [Plectosphaerella plurivora]